MVVVVGSNGVWVDDIYENGCSDLRPLIKKWSLCVYKSLRSKNPKPIRLRTGFK